MDSKRLKEELKERLAARLARLGLTPDDLSPELDLVRTGVLDSLGFVDLVTELEGVAGQEVDLDAAFDRPGATTVAGLLDLFSQQA